MSEEASNSEQQQADDWSQAMAEQAAAEAAANSSGQGGQVQQAQLANLHAESLSADESANLEAILDIPVSLSVEIGHTRISIRNLLQLNQGSVVELDRLAGEPLDVLVNNTLIAHGEIVVVNEKYGIRLTDVISAHDRVKKLQ